MKSALIFDTETTGVPKNSWSDWSNCRLIQLAWIVVDESFNVLNEQNFIINDTSYSSPQDVIDIHHITEQMRLDYGVEANLALNAFIYDCSKVDVIVSHSNPFDIGVIYNECKLRNILLNGLLNKNIYDTQKTTEYISRKPTTLVQTITELDPEYKPPNGLQPHDALYDTYLCTRLFQLSNTKQNYKFKEMLKFIDKCIRNPRYK